MKWDLLKPGWEPEKLCLVPLFFLAPSHSACLCVCECECEAPFGCDQANRQNLRWAQGPEAQTLQRFLG